MARKTITPIKRRLIILPIRFYSEEIALAVAAVEFLVAAMAY
jgi:hypothetical protein